MDVKCARQLGIDFNPQPQSQSYSQNVRQADAQNIMRNKYVEQKTKEQLLFLLYCIET